MEQNKVKSISKKITCIIIILMLCNFIIPNLLIPKTSLAADSSSIFDKNITFSSQYIKGNGDIMPHGIITPSTASSSSSIPLIVWLHGDGEFGGGESTCMGDSNKNLFPRALMDSSLEKFSAYILLPHATGDWKTTSSDGKPTWYSSEARKNVSTLIENFVKEKGNVDINNIIIAGHSRGGMGAQYMAANMDKMSYKFSKLAVLSGYNVGINFDNIKIPTRGYVGTDGKDSAYSFMTGTFASHFENIKVTASHATVPRIVYNLDNDNNGRSDLIEWMFDNVNNTGEGIGSSGGTDGEIYIQRIEVTGDEGDLFNDMAQMFCFIPDVVIDFLQKMFVNSNSIEVDDTTWSIHYSPGTIFAGKIPAFDINFINVKEKNNTITYDDYVKKVLDDNFSNAKGNYDNSNYEFAKKQDNANYVYGYITLDQNNNIATNSTSTKPVMGYGDPSYVPTYFGETYACYWVDEKNEKLIIECKYPTAIGSNYQGMATGPEIYYSFSVDINDEEVQAAKKTEEYKSSSFILQPIIATWYNTLRRIALVGLLSVLVYIGIRIVLTSTSAKDKAKYKKMLKDWLVALCLLFTLHYIMSITITIVEEVNEIFASSVVRLNGEDVLMTTVRNSIASAGKWKQVVAQVIIYFVLGVYTIIFTIQYVRRTIYLAFLTMIAPLITLTYPLDKIKDNKSQAFDMWIKDYVFFTLLQVVHLLLYYILVGSSIQLTNSNNWLFAIVAIGFLTKAEKIIKKMFGFEKSNSMGALAAGASGALVMNAINKMKGMGGKGGKSGASGGSGGAEETGGNKIRTATGDPLSSLRARIQGTGGEGVTAPITTASTGTNTTGGSTTQSANSGASGQSGKPSRSLSGGAGSIFKKYTGPSVKKILGTTSDLFLGGTGALVGLAAGVAQGDVGSAFTGALAGAAAGKGLRQGVTNKAVSMGNSIKNFGHEFMDTAREGAYGADYAEMVKFKRSSDYQELKKNHKDSLTDENLQTMISAGITQKDAMGKILKNGSDNIEDAIGYYTLAKECPDSIYYDTDKLTQFIEDKLTEDGQNISRAEIQEIVSNMKKYR